MTTETATTYSLSLQLSNTLVIVEAPTLLELAGIIRDELGNDNAPDLLYYDETDQVWYAPRGLLDAGEPDTEDGGWTEQPELTTEDVAEYAALVADTVARSVTVEAI